MDRDRDAAGRARNARPRDGLGRPLPHGSPGVPRQAEGVVRTPRQTVTEAQQLLDAGRPFHAHEVFEDAWKSTDGGDAGLWKALAQLAVGRTHQLRGNEIGAERLLHRAATGLEPYVADPPHGLAVRQLRAWALGDYDAAMPALRDHEERGESLPGLGAACRALAAGRAVVVPNPSPMAYGIVAPSAAAVNALKRRPPDQNVAVSMHDPAQWEDVATCLDVPPDRLPAIVRLLRQRLSLLVPMRTGSAPGWLAPAVRHGYLAMFDPRWEATARLWDDFPPLYGSSANRTGYPPAASADEAVAIFGADAIVVDGDALRDPGVPHAASTMVQMTPDGRLRLYRTGAQDAGTEPEEFLRRLG